MDFAFDLYTSVLPVDKDKLTHQMFIFWLILATGGTFMYLAFASMSYNFYFRRLRRQFFPKTIDPEDEAELWRQVKHEIWIATCSIPFMAILMMPAATFAHRGYSQLYHNVSDYGWGYFLVSPLLFFSFTDFMVYCFHRGLHHPIIYKRVHKLHHTYKFTTPFSSHAFNPVDGFGQGVPYYIFVYLFPLHSTLFICLFVMVNFWTISIHDQVDFGGHFMNTTGHHTIHHELFNYDYGQYTTVWDRLGGSYRPAEQTHQLTTLLHACDQDYVDPVYATYHDEKGFLAGRFKEEAAARHKKTV
ncbi:Lathosterol oxidase-like protein [Leptomonas pyrrhocoris]|uniref:Lathosterol oxidase-like protein n=1 Tax=Leptomonas pyrrhocoris TaxID=157538 RepID=A0A0M9G7C6_LEPPY|nr:Lathosterol oxidase-like protein [Leptomonas pyrrhocoris]XP_015662289.1 Lathosterol oxidase-like protein [Leptomonas pyrrhocoris]KPA83849.1 Lathosterol oxidase-like protein [Leptomonas pyrrhocoris]KPA83850.1 Lathosterol oxidase-like protein [Leptomonas pyrrhocoris]|eukprot:XP_015662288.1 Lathosterol oxidase-like protein [Leptomonas pyrrhocoris]